MPVLLEHLHSPSSADWQDLEKIHLDTAETGLLLNNQQLEQWLADGGWIMAGRFNDRLLGTVLAKDNGDYVELSQAAVRKLTQRRGVMHQLLHFICLWCKDNNKALLVQNAPEFVQQSLLKRGFQNREGNCYYPSEQ